MTSVGTLIIGLIFLVMLIVAYAQGTRQCQVSMLRGFWEASSEFCDESGLQLFSVYIGKSRNNVYPCYFLMVDSEDTILINEPSCFTLKEPLSNLTTTGDCREFYATFDNLETDLLPNVMKLKYYPQTSKIIFSDESKIYAALFKNPVLSELERISKESSNEPISSCPSKTDNTTVECDDDAEAL